MMNHGLCLMVAFLHLAFVFSITLELEFVDFDSNFSFISIRNCQNIVEFDIYEVWPFLG